MLVSYLTIKRSAYTQALDYIVVLPLTISGTVLGIALVQTFNTGWLVLAGTSAIMVLCYTVRRLPFAVQRLVGAVQHPRLDRRSLDQPGRVAADDLLRRAAAMKASIISAAL